MKSLKYQRGYAGTIQSGDLLIWELGKLHQVTSILELLIQMFLRTSFNHVGLALVVKNELGENEVHVVEANIPRVRMFKLSESERHLYHIPTHIRWKPEYTKKLLSYIGKKYAYLEVISHLFNVKPSTTKYFCTELVVDFYRSIGFFDEHEGSYNPRHLIRELQIKTGSGIYKIASPKD